MSYISPDVSAYTDLRIYDRQPTDLVLRAVTDAQSKLPGINLIEGTNEMTMIEGFALEVAEEVYAINRLPGAITAVLLGLFNITQLPGAPPTATVTFSVIDTSGYTIPAGTNLRIPSALTGAGDVYFTTDAPATAAPGSATTAAVGTTGTSNTDAANALPAGTAVDIVDAVYVANGCTLASAVASGALPETALAFLSRGITALQSLNSTLVLEPQFVIFALSNGAYRAMAQDNYDATIPETAAGVISVAVMGENGALLTSDQKSAMAIAMNAQTQANLVVRVLDPTITTVAVNVTVMAQTGQDPTALQTAITAAINGWLSTDTWPWDGVVRLSKLTNIVETAAGVDYVVFFTTPTIDTVLQGFGPLAKAGAITVNVLTAPPSTTLAAAIASTSASSLTVTLDTEFPPGPNPYKIQIDNEVLEVTAGQGTTTWTVTRAIDGSVAATHSSGATVTLL